MPKGYHTFRFKTYVQCLYCSRFFYGYGYSEDDAFLWALSYRAKHFYKAHFSSYIERIKNVSSRPVFTSEFKQQNLVFP